MSRWLAALVVACLGLFARPAWAAACCSSATVFGVGRLLVWEDSAFGFQLGAANGLGRWATDGTWRPFGASYSESELSPSAFAIVRLDRRWELQARAPWIVNLRAAGDVSTMGHALGDVLAAVRYELTGVGEYLELPAIAFTAGVLAPTGRREEQSVLPLGADASGRGVWEGSASVAIEQTWTPWFLRLDLGGRASLPFLRADNGRTQRYGPGLTVALTGGAEVLPGFSLAMLLQHEREGALVVDDRVLEGSGMTAYAASAAASWRFLPHWTAQLAVTGGLYQSGWGTNRPGRLSTTLGLRYGHF